MPKFPHNLQRFGAMTYPRLVGSVPKPGVQLEAISGWFTYLTGDEPTGNKEVRFAFSGYLKHNKKDRTVVGEMVDSFYGQSVVAGVLNSRNDRMVFDKWYRDALHLDVDSLMKTGTPVRYSVYKTCVDDWVGYYSPCCAKPESDMMQHLINQETWKDLIVKREHHDVACVITPLVKDAADIATLPTLKKL